MPEFPTITHVALTVSDLQRSIPWYRRLFDGDPVLDEDTGPVPARGLAGRWPDPGRPPPVPRPRRRPYRSTSAAWVWTIWPSPAPTGELEQWQARLEELGIPHGGVVDAPYGSGLSFRDPDNIALEFFAPPS